MVDEVRNAATETIARNNPAGLLYGMILAAAVLSASVGHVEGPVRLAVLVVFVVLVYWLADVYVRVFAHHFAGERTGLGQRLRSAGRHEFSVLLGAVPALVVTLVAPLLGADLSVAVDVALWLTVLELAAFGYLAARRVGTSRSTAAVEALVAGLLGVLMIVGKALLH